MADHPVKVPPELAQQWLSEPYKDGTAQHIANRAAQWGADQQLEKVNDWIRCLGDDSRTGIRWELEIVQLDRLGRELWQAMRPKPPTLAEQALKLLPDLGMTIRVSTDQAKTIRAALNRLAELEAQQ